MSRGYDISALRINSAGIIAEYCQAYVMPASAIAAKARQRFSATTTVFIAL